MQQVGRLWTQRLEGSQSNRSQPLPPVAKNGLDTVFGHSPVPPPLQAIARHRCNKTTSENTPHETKYK